MKIGIITLNTRTNYGGILQAYALSLTLRNMGHTVYHIYRPVKWKIKTIKYPSIILKRLFKRYFKKEHNVIFLEMHLNKTFSIVSQHTQKFIDTNIPYITTKDFKYIKKNDFDAYIVGSDQIWRPSYMPDIENAFLKFTQNWNVKRIAYAASFGTDKWEYSPKETIKCRELLKKFDFVSIREIDCINMCYEKLGIMPKYVLDPTLLLSASDYINLIKNYEKEDKGDLLCYILDENQNKSNIIDKLSNKLKFKAFRVNSLYEDVTAPTIKRIQPPVENWLKGFYKAQFVITDSFHACVFSIIFNKPFYVIGNADRGLSRFKSLLSTFKLDNRLIFTEDDIPDVAENINWEFINNRKEELKKSSLEYLKKVLS